MANGLFEPVVIRASAGTGKTFRLTNRYLALAATDKALDSVLATTFTRKAAGEILDRILQRLAAAALDPQQRRRLGEQLGRDDLDPARCRELLRGMTRLLHRLRVGTLDSFFIQIAQSFSLELGLPPNWRIVDEIEDQALRRRAIRMVLEEGSVADTLALMHLLAKGEATRSVSEQIFQLVQEIYSVYLESPEEAWKCLPTHKPLDARELEEALARLQAITRGELCNHGSAEKSRDGDLERARKGEWLEFIKTGIAKKIVEGTNEFYGKPLQPEALEVYAPLIQHARAELVNLYRNQTEATHRLLEHFDRAYQRVKLAERALRFEDVTRRLSGALTGGWLDHVAFRLDGRIDHVLLDEFQDTSAIQWQVLEPLARHATDTNAGRSFFCVGDVKQAIYGWRGGLAEIFEAIDTRLQGLQSEALVQSHRSCQAVIDTVNQVFSGLGQCAPLEKHPRAARHWSTGFAAHSTAKSDLRGYCRLVAAPAAGEEEKQDDVTLRFAAAEIARLHREAPGCSIGVLVRRNRAIGPLMFALRAEHGIVASEEGGNPLIDSPAVQLVLSLLTLADHPGDTTARYHVAHSPLADAVELTRWNDAGQACRLSLRLRQQIMAEGYGRTIYGWLQHLAPVCDDRDLNRLLQLVDLGHLWQARAGGRVDRFIEFVEQHKVEDPSSAQVRVMSVHQAKGLQFDIVVLPELECRLTGQPARLVTGRAGPCGPIATACRYVPDDVRKLLLDSIGRVFDEHEQRVVEESLCLLYVAITRPIHALHMIVPPAKPREKNLTCTFSGVLRATLAPDVAASPGALLYEHGDPAWYVDRPTCAPPAPVPELGPIRLAQRATKRRRDLDRRSPSQLEGGREVDLAFRLRLDAAAALDRGTVIHAWFQQIEWLDEDEPCDAALAACVPSELRRRFDTTALLADFRHALKREAIRQALTRGPLEKPDDDGSCAVHAGATVQSPRWRVWREKPFAVRDEAGLLTGFIDRLVVLFDGERPVAADVLDFKTDALDAHDTEAVAARVEHYRPQLAAYRRAVGYLFGLPPARISARLLFVGPGIVRSV